MLLGASSDKCSQKRKATRGGGKKERGKKENIRDGKQKRETETEADDEEELKKKVRFRCIIAKEKRRRDVRRTLGHYCSGVSLRCFHLS